MRWMMVLLVVAALGVGYGLGSLSRGDSGGAAGRAERGVSDAVAPEGPASSWSPDASLPSLVDSLAIDPPPAGTGKIVGRVIDDEGKGVAGAVVVAQPVDSRLGRRSSAADGRPKQKPLIDYVKSVARREAERRAGTREATTDEDGRYALTGLGSESYSVHAYKTGYRARATPRHGGWIKPDAELNFKATRVVRVDVDVTLAGGERPDTANISYAVKVDGGKRLNSSYWTREQRWIEIPPGTYTLQASLSDGSDAKSNEETIVVDPEDPPAPVSLLIVIKPSMRITVVPPPGFESVKAFSVALRFTGEKPPADDLLIETRSQMRAWPDEEGRTLLRNLEPGRYLVGASISYNDPIAVRKVVELAEGQLEVGLHLPAPDPARHFLVRPLAPDGKPLAGLQWSTSFRGDRRSGSGGVSALYRSDGVVFVSQLDRYRGMEGKHFVVATHQAYGALSQEVAPSAGAPFTLQFREPAFVDAIVAGYVGSGREGRLKLGLQRDEMRRYDTLSPDSKGRATFGPVQPGDYKLRLESGSSRRGNSELASTPVSLRSGKQQASIAIPVLHDLKLTWTGKGKPTFMLVKGNSPRRASGRSMRVEADAKGVATFRDLVSGDYVLRVANVSPGIEARVVTIPGTSELTLP